MKRRRRTARRRWLAAALRHEIRDLERRITGLRAELRVNYGDVRSSDRVIELADLTEERNDLAFAAGKLER